MTKFIEVTDSKYKSKTLIPVDKILYVEDADDSESNSYITLALTFSSKRREFMPVTLGLLETYEQVKNLIKECDLK